MTNDQRMVDVELLEKLVTRLNTEEWQNPLPSTELTKLRALLDGPGVEPVAWVRFCSDGGYEGPIMNASMEDVRKNSGAWTPLYLAAPSAPVHSDDQDPFDKSRLKPLVTQVFGEGWRIVPPEAPVQTIPVAYHDKDQPEGIAWCPGYPEKLKDICPLYTQAPVQAVQEAVEKLEACDKTLRELRGKYPGQAVPDGMALVPETIARLFTKEQLEFLASGYDLKYLPIYANQPDPTYIVCWLFEVRDEHGKAVCSREVMYTAIDDAMLAAAPQPPATTDKENGE